LAKVEITGLARQPSRLPGHTFLHNGGYTNIVPTYISTTSATTRADGTFDDAPVGICQALPFTSPLTSTQTIQVLLNGQPYKIRTNNWKFSSTNLTNHGTVTNGGDVN
jgi:hypothetical protein